MVSELSFVEPNLKYGSCFQKRVRAESQAGRESSQVRGGVCEWGLCGVLVSLFLLLLLLLLKPTPACCHPGHPSVLHRDA